LTRLDPVHSHAHGEVCTHAHPPHEAIAAAERIAGERGLNMTAMRKDVLSVLADSPKPLGAYDIIAALPERKGRKPAPILVYRALDFLIEAGFVHRIQSRNAFFACVHGHKPSDLVVLMICENCGCASESGSDDVRQALDTLAGKNGFSPASRVVEMFGRCAHCRT
jgi:Fur family zinc uptake transcriptional regulator